jgi:hypothetical protein
MKKNNLLFTVFSLMLLMFLFSCNSTEQKVKEEKIDSVKQDSIRKAEFLGKYDRYFNDIARFIAGMEQEKGSSLAKFDTMNAAKEYRISIGEFFTRVNDKNISKMRAFSDNELKDIRKDSLVLFYPFSGPDFINSDALFPEAFTTVMLGLEPVGGVPDISDATNDELKTMFKALRISIDSIAPLGYFMTNEMNRDFRRVSDLNGTLPVITLFMARNNYRILNVKKVTIDSEGKLVERIAGQVDKDDPTDTYISGGMIEYMKPNDWRVRKVYYFSHDASDESLAKTPQLLKLFGTIHIDVAFFKAASYLCSWMTDMRNFTLTNAQTIVQDDSGIPISYFDKNQWNMRFYGKYERTLKVFQKGFFQKDLKQIYDTCKTVKPLDFSFGYGVRIKQSNMLVAKKK